jgi:hypothetical protein
MIKDKVTHRHLFSPADFEELATVCFDTPMSPKQ